MHKIIIMGDIHGNWRHPNVLINKKRPDMILQAGDFGWWPRQHLEPEQIGYNGSKVITRPWDQFGLRNNKADGSPIEVLACPGNHEDWANLKEIWGQGKTEVMPGVHIMPWGATYTLPDGRTVLFCGGADSHDKASRTLDVDWFEESCPGEEALQDLPDVHVDIVISHTCPSEFIEFGPRAYSERGKDPTVQILSHVLAKYKPGLWYFGHWHEYTQGKYEGCTWAGLNMAGKTGWWAWL